MTIGPKGAPYRVSETTNYEGYFLVWESEGWCVGRARSRREAENIKAELEAGTLHSPVLYPETRET